jgi:hypothetical protein
MKRLELEKREAQLDLGDKNSKRDFSASPAGAQPPEPLLGDPSETRPRSWGRQNRRRHNHFVGALSIAWRVGRRRQAPGGRCEASEGGGRSATISPCTIQIRGTLARTLAGAISVVTACRPPAGRHWGQGAGSAFLDTEELG